MAEHDLTSPLIPSQPSDLIITVRDAEEDDSKKTPDHLNNSSHVKELNFGNPYEFLGSRGPDVPAPSTIDPFRNQTPGTVDGIYEALKMVLCLPIVAIRLALFGLCLGVGYVATRVALHGWEDKQNPMPKWRCRVMWITRICARFILFSFG